MSKNLILLVEDNPDDIELTRRAFRETYPDDQVVNVRDGADALDFLFQKGKHADREGKAHPSLILLDLKLPKIDGLEVLRRIRAAETTRLLPVVVLTSSNEERDIRESYELGANSYIRKPVDFGEFSEVVRRLGNYWLVLNESPH